MHEYMRAYMHCTRACSEHMCMNILYAHALNKVHAIHTQLSVYITHSISLTFVRPTLFEIENRPTCE